MAKAANSTIERLLSVAQVADLLGTTERFPRRLIAERRITKCRHCGLPPCASSLGIRASGLSYTLNCGARCPQVTVAAPCSLGRVPRIVTGLRGRFGRVG